MSVCLVGNGWWHGDTPETPEVVAPEGPPADDPSSVGASKEYWARFGYSLSEARRNFQTQGDMFRPDTPCTLRTEVASNLRGSLVRLLQRAMAEPSKWNGDDRKNAEELRDLILDELASAKVCS